MIFINCNFYFNGISANDLGIKIVRVGSDNDIMPVFGAQSVIEQETVGGEYSTFMRTKKQNIQFTLTFSLLEKGFTPDKIRQLGMFFANSVPVEFMIEEDMSKVIKIVPTSQIDIVRFGELRGYFQVSFQAVTPYWLTPLEVIEYDFSNMPIGSQNYFSIENKTNIQNKYGAYDIFPYVRITVSAFSPDDPFGIFGLRDMNTDREIVILNVHEGEIYELQNKNLIFTTADGLKSNALDRWNKTSFVLHKGLNEFSSSGRCKLTVNLQYPIF